MEINRAVAEKVLATVDAGLCRGVGNPVPGQMCVERDGGLGVNRVAVLQHRRD